MTRTSVLVAAAILIGCTVGPNEEVGDSTESGEGDGDPGDGDPGDGDPGDGDPGDGDPGDGDPGDGDPGDGDGEQGCVDETGDGDYPGLCSCEPEGAPCFQGCVLWVEGLTCEQVCAAQGETCVEFGCGVNTAVGGNQDCPAPSEYGAFYDIACTEPLPEPFMGEGVYDCCCTRP